VLVATWSGRRRRTWPENRSAHALGFREPQPSNLQLAVILVKTSRGRFRRMQWEVEVEVPIKQRVEICNGSRRFGWVCPGNRQEKEYRQEEGERIFHRLRYKPYHNLNSTNYKTCQTTEGELRCSDKVSRDSAVALTARERLIPWPGTSRSHPAETAHPAAMKQKLASPPGINGRVRAENGY